VGASGISAPDPSKVICTSGKHAGADLESGAPSHAHTAGSDIQGW
jgi:hypothetical protein